MYKTHTHTHAQNRRFTAVSQIKFVAYFVMIFLLLFADQMSLCRGATTVNAGENETWKTSKLAFPSLSTSDVLMALV